MISELRWESQVEKLEKLSMLKSFFELLQNFYNIDFAFSRWFRLLGFSHTHGDRPSLHRGQFWWSGVVM